MLKKLLIIHLAVSAIICLAAGLIGAPHNAIGAALGSSLMGINLFALVWAWARIFSKKSIALAVSVIVFKYAILGAIIYFVMNSEKIDNLGFAVGLLAAFPSITVFALQHGSNGSKIKSVVE